MLLSEFDTYPDQAPTSVRNDDEHTSHEDRPGVRFLLAAIATTSRHSPKTGCLRLETATASFWVLRSVPNHAEFYSTVVGCHGAGARPETDPNVGMNSVDT